MLLTFATAPGVGAAAEGNAAHGKRLYEKDCIACHASSGAGDWFKAVPALAGQRPAYLQGQLDAFAKGARKSSSMHWVLRRRPLNQGADRAALISYLSQLPTSGHVLGAVRGDEALGQSVYDSSCAACHGSDGLGSGPQPIISRQQYSYLVDRLRDMRERDSTDVAPAMTSAVRLLTDSQIAAVANLLSRMPAATPQ